MPCPPAASDFRGQWGIENSLHWILDRSLATTSPAYEPGMAQKHGRRRGLTAEELADLSRLERYERRARPRCKRARRNIMDIEVQRPKG